MSCMRPPGRRMKFHLYSREGSVNDIATSQPCLRKAIIDGFIGLALFLCDKGQQLSTLSLHTLILGGSFSVPLTVNLRSYVFEIPQSQNKEVDTNSMPWCGKLAYMSARYCNIFINIYIFLVAGYKINSKNNRICEGALWCSLGINRAQAE